MLQHLVDLVSETFDPGAAYRHIKKLAGLHRIPASDAHHDAALWAAGQLRKYGLETELESYPTDGNRMYWSYVTPPRWECREGWLDQITPGGTVRLADWNRQPLSIIQRSVSTGGILEAELAVVDDEVAANAIGERLRDKIILSSASPGEVLRWAVRRYGAAGMITDVMTSDPPVRKAGDLSDALQWALFPYTRRKPPEGWGFVVSPATGQQLREACRKGPVRLRASIESETGEGRLDNLSAFLPGTEPEEVWLIAHLCHPAPFANDNASGAAALLECARTIWALLREGKLPPLRRGIRFLFPVEIAGTIAHLSSHPELAHRAIAGLNLDMVGSSQERTGSVLCIDRPPDCTPGCLPELLELLYEKTDDHCSGLSGSSHYPLFRQTTTGFSGGSDHWILSDPSVGIPTPMLIEWPDRTYHTTADVLRNIDLKTLRRNGIVAASYALFLASAGPDEARWLGSQAVGKFISQLGDAYRRTDQKGPENRRDEIEFRTARQTAHLEWLRSIGGAELDDADGIPAWTACIRSVGETLSQAIHPEAPAAEAIHSMDESDWVVERVYPGPISHFAHVGTLSEDDQEAFRMLCTEHPHASKTLYKHITHWMDGARTTREIADLLATSVGLRDDVFLVAYLKALEQLGLVTLHRR